MAAVIVPQTGSKEVESCQEPKLLDVGWFFPKPNLQWLARQLLQQYSGYLPSEMVAEITKFVSSPEPHSDLP